MGKKANVTGKPLAKPSKPEEAVAAAPVAKKPRLANVEGEGDAAQRKKEKKAKPSPAAAKSDDKPSPAAAEPTDKKKKKKKDKKKKKPVAEGEAEADGAPKPAAATPAVKREPKHPKKPLTEAQKTGVLKKTLVGISSGVCEEQETEFTFNKVRDLALELGAEIAPTIHKRVSMLLVTGKACQRNTQKVRKAQRFKVPLVRAQDYLAACKLQQQKLPVDDYLATVQE